MDFNPDYRIATYYEFREKVRTGAFDMTHKIQGIPLRDGFLFNPEDKTFKVVTEKARLPKDMPVNIIEDECVIYVNLDPVVFTKSVLFSGKIHLKVRLPWWKEKYRLIKRTLLGRKGFKYDPCPIPRSFLMGNILFYDADTGDLYFCVRFKTPLVLIEGDELMIKYKLELMA